MNIDTQPPSSMIDSPGAVATNPSSTSTPVNGSLEASVTNVFHHHRRYACVAMNDLTRAAGHRELDFTLLVTYRPTIDVDDANAGSGGVVKQVQYEKLLQSVLDDIRTQSRSRDSISSSILLLDVLPSREEMWMAFSGRWNLIIIIL